MERNVYDDYYGDDGIPGELPPRENPFYEPPRRQKKGAGIILKLWRLVYPVLIHGVGTGIVSEIFITVFLFLTVLLGMFRDSGAAYDFLYNNQIALSGAAELIIFVPLLSLFMRDERIRRADVPEECLAKKKMGISDWLTVLAFVMCLAIVVNLVIALLNLPESEIEQEMEELYEKTGLLVQVIVIGVIAPLAEDMTFRGLVFRRLREDLDPLFAALLSGLAFGIYHGNLTQGVFATVMGFVFAMLYEHYGTIMVPIAAHMLNNLYATLANELLYSGNFDIPDPVYYAFLAAACVGTAALAVFIFKDDEKCNQY